MYASTTAFGTMIDDAQIVYEVKVSLPDVYGDVTVAVESITIDRSYTTDMPDKKRIQEGIPAATATITLKGPVDDTDPSKTVAWLFGPYQTSSPLFRSSVLQQKVTIDIGGYPAGSNGVPEMFRKFTGVISRKPVVRDGTVTLTCVDMRGTWRDAPTPILLNSSGASNTGLTSEFALDTLSRQASDHASLTWPAPLTDCLVAAGMRTSTLPEVGKLLADYTPAFTAGLTGSALSGGGKSGHGSATGGSPANLPHLMAAEYTFGPPYALGGGTIGAATSTSQFLVAEFVITGDVAANPVVLAFSNASGPNIPAPDWAGYVALKVNSTGIDVMSTQFATKTWTVTVAPGTHTVGLWMSWTGTTVALKVILDGTVNTFTGFTATKFAAAVNYASIGWYSSLTSATPAATIEALQIAANSAGAPVLTGGFTTSYPFTPTAHIDPSLNPLVAIPQLTGDTWSVVQQIAEAELGVAGFDEAGGFFFKNRVTLRSSTSVRQLTSTNSIDDMTVEESVDGVANRVQVEALPYRFGAKSTIWQLDEPTKIAQGLTKTFTVSTVGQPDHVVGRRILGPAERVDDHEQFLLPAVGRQGRHRGGVERRVHRDRHAGDGNDADRRGHEQHGRRRLARVAGELSRHHRRDAGVPPGRQRRDAR
jgi:hypothetical protein